MTYQPERDGYGVANTRGEGSGVSTHDDRPVVVEDDGTRRTADDRPVVVEADGTSSAAAERPVTMDADSSARTMDARPEVVAADGTTRTAQDHPLVDDGSTTRTDELGGGDRRTQQGERAGLEGDGADGSAGRHARALDAEDTHAVVADDPRVVRGQRVDTVAMPMAPDAVVARERAAYGGVKWGSAFFGWLTAIGLAVILTGLVAGAGTALGLANDVSSADVVNEVANGSASTIGIAGAIAVLLIILVSYFAGGYVAGRMARFDGARQGFAVWLWSIVIAAVLGIVGLIAGDQWDVLGNLNAFPRFPVDANSLSTAGLVALVMAVVVSLLGAILGGLAGMGFHRKVDAAAFDPERVELPA
jgi:hypothetical protein